MQQLFSYPANVISSSIFAFASTSVVEFLFTTSAPAFPFVRLHFLGDLLRAFGIFTDMVIILKISQPMRKISNTFTNLGILTSHMKKRFIHRKTINRAPSRQICTCSMLTVTLLLLYRKLIPLRFLPWCDNLVTLGCRRILVFLCFSKVKNRRLVRAFRVPSRQPLDQIG